MGMGRRPKVSRAVLAAGTMALIVGVLPQPGAAASVVPGSVMPRAVMPGAGSDRAPALPGPGSTTLRLPDGSTAVVDPHAGVARVTASDGTITYRRVPASGQTSDGSAATITPDKAQLAALLARPPRAPYAADHIVVVFDDDSAPTKDAFAASQTDLAKVADGGSAPAFTPDMATNRALADAGVIAEARLFADVPRSRLRELAVAAAPTADAKGLALANAYQLTISTGDPVAAARAVLALPGVQLAELDRTVEAPGTTTALSASASAAALRTAGSLDDTDRGRDAGPATSRGSWRLNYGIRSTAQSFWNSPGLDAAAAYDEIDRAFQEMPGQGQTITDVGLGDLTDDNPGSRCFGSGFGPTTIVQGGQRYIDLPSMPLVPTYTASARSRLDPLGEVCGPDPLLRSIGHELSVMAPLPQDQQRPSNPGNGLTDLLGLAPGARYRVVVPASAEPVVSDVTAALLAAALQSPRPDVITTGLTASGDSQGFPARYLEQDPLAEAMVRMIVNSLHIPVCVAAGDGVRRNSSIAAFGTSGGSTATQVVGRTEAETGLDDVALSSAPSTLHDSGAIAVGASTQNDIFAKPPHYASEIDAQRQLPYAATRWTGATDFASGFGSRVDVSAPGDSILSMSHLAGGSATDAQPNLAEGTGVSAAEVAAAVAVVSRVAELTGQPFDTPRALRAYLATTATRLADVPQADRGLEIGSQLNLKNAVEGLLASGGQPAEPAMARFVISQRRPLANLGALFETGTDPDLIDLTGPRSPITGQLTGANKRAWITIAPDWEAIPGGSTYGFYVRNDEGITKLADTPSTRVTAEQLLLAAGRPTHSPTRQQISVFYTVESPGGASLTRNLRITFSASPRTSSAVRAPRVAPVVSGNQVSIRYDLRQARALQVPVQLVVSYPARANPATGAMYDPMVSIDLPFAHGDPASRVGTVQIPVDQLEGAGIYGVGLHVRDDDVDGFLTPAYSDFAYTRVPASSTAQPTAPLVARVGHSGAGGLRHHAEIGYRGDVRVTWDATAVPGADGAFLEVSSPGPASAIGVNTFNNPEGDLRDDNGVDTGSVRFLDLGAVAGSRVFGAAELGILPTMTHGVRVLAAHGDAVAGEASPVSTITREGVKPVGNGPINESGFAVGTGAEIGYVATRRFRNDFSQDSSVQTFDPQTTVIGRTVAGIEAGQSSYRMVGNGQFGAGAGLFGEFDAFSQGEALSFTAIGDGGALPWTPPDPARLQVRGGGADPASGVGAFVALDTSDGSPTAFRAFTSRVASNRFGPVFDLSGGLAGAPVARLNQVVFDQSSHWGMAGFASNDFCAAPILERFDTSSKTAGPVPGVGFGDPFSMGVDRSSGVVAVANSCSPDLGLYDLGDGSSSLVDLGQNGYYVASDDADGLFLVAKAVPPDFFDNHVVQSSIAVFDSHGTYLKEVTGVYLWDIGLVPGLDALQVDPSTRTAWIFGPFGRQLEPVDY